MSFIKSLFFKIIIYIGYKKEDYIFNRSKKFILNWGEGSYGLPRINCYDQVSRLHVGRYCSIAANVSILLGANHKLNCITTYPYCKINKSKTLEDSSEKGDVVIGDDVWVGFGALIIGPVVIGNGAIIGAGAVVVEDIPPYSVAVGVPAKVVKYRFSDDNIKELLKIKWWDWEILEIEKASEYLYSQNGISNFIEKYKVKNHD